MNVFDRLTVEEEINSLILTETSESTNPERENRLCFISERGGS